METGVQFPVAQSPFFLLSCDDIIFGEARARGGGGGGFGTHGNDGVAPARQAGDSEQRRCQGRSGRPRGGEQGDEAEESPSNKGAMRARGEATFELQGV